MAVVAVRSPCCGWPRLPHLTQPLHVRGGPSLVFCLWTIEVTGVRVQKDRKGGLCLLLIAPPLYVVDLFQQWAAKEGRELGGARGKITGWQRSPDEWSSGCDSLMQCSSCTHTQNTHICPPRHRPTAQTFEVEVCSNPSCLMWWNILHITLYTKWMQWPTVWKHFRI